MRSHSEQRQEIESWNLWEVGLVLLGLGMGGLFFFWISSPFIGWVLHKASYLEAYIAISINYISTFIGYPVLENSHMVLEALPNIKPPRLHLQLEREFIYFDNESRTWGQIRDYLFWISFVDSIVLMTTLWWFFFRDIVVPSRLNKKLLQEMKERIRPKNKKDTFFTHDKMLAGFMRKESFIDAGSFVTLEYMPARLKGVADEVKDNNEEYLNSYVMDSIKYSFSEVNNSSTRYRNATKLYSELRKSVKEWLTLYVFTEFAVIPEKERDVLILDMLAKKNHMKYLNQLIELSEWTIEDKRGEDTVNLSLVFAKKGNSSISLKDFSTFLSIMWRKGKPTALNTVELTFKKPISFRMDSTAAELFGNVTSVVQLLKETRDPRFNKLARDIESGKENISELMTIAKREVILYARKHLADLNKWYIDGQRGEYGIKRLIMPDFYVLTPIAGKKELSQFTCKGFQEFLYPVFKEIEADHKVKIEKQKKSLRDAIKIAKAEGQESSVTRDIELLLKDVENSEADTTENSRMYKIKRFMAIHQYEETAVLAIYDYMRDISNAPMGALAGLKYFNLALWYALTSWGRPMHFISGIPIWAIYLDEKRRAEEGLRKEKIIVEDSDILFDISRMLSA